MGGCRFCATFVCFSPLVLQLTTINTNSVVVTEYVPGTRIDGRSNPAGGA